MCLGVPCGRNFLLLGCGSAVAVLLETDVAYLWLPGFCREPSNGVVHFITVPVHVAWCVIGVSTVVSSWTRANHLPVASFSFLSQLPWAGCIWARLHSVIFCQPHTIMHCWLGSVVAYKGSQFGRRPFSSISTQYNEYSLETWTSFSLRRPQWVSFDDLSECGSFELEPPPSPTHVLSVLIACLRTEHF